MEIKIYQVLGRLDEKGYKITASSIIVKETEKSYKVVDSKGAYCYWALLPQKMVDESIVSDDRYINNFNRIQYEAYCKPEYVEVTMLKVKEKIDEFYNNCLKSFQKVQKSFYNLETIKVNNK